MPLCNIRAFSGASNPRQSLVGLRHQASPGGVELSGESASQDLSQQEGPEGGKRRKSDTRCPTWLQGVPCSMQFAHLGH